MTQSPAHPTCHPQSLRRGVSCVVGGVGSRPGSLLTSELPAAAVPTPRPVCHEGAASPMACILLTCNPDVAAVHSAPREPAGARPGKAAFAPVRVTLLLVGTESE